MGQGYSGHSLEPQPCCSEFLEKGEFIMAAATNEGFWGQRWHLSQTSDSLEKESEFVGGRL